MTTFVLILMIGFSLICLLPLLSYPLLLLIRKPLPSLTALDEPYSLPKISLLCVVRNGEKLIEKKINNSLELDYPKNLLEIVFASDSSEDKTNEILKQASEQHSQIKFYNFEEHQGKNATLNKMFSRCEGDIIVLSDADAEISKDSLHQLIRHFKNPKIGGVCGQRLIAGKQTDLSQAQSTYIDADSWIKKLESQRGSMSSNDGKLYAVRKELLNEIPLTVTDDLFNCLNVIKQHYRFIFEPKAYAYIVKPAKNAKHELSRRRRITARSLTGIYFMRCLLNPKHYGFFAISLFINKVLRRCLSVVLLVLFLGSLLIAISDLFFLLFFLLQVVFYLIATLFLSRLKNGFKPRTPLDKIQELIAYFVLGNLGCLLGITDFLTGKRYSQWQPVK